MKVLIMHNFSYMQHLKELFQYEYDVHCAYHTNDAVNLLNQYAFHLAITKRENIFISNWSVKSFREYFSIPLYVIDSFKNSEEKISIIEAGADMCSGVREEPALILAQAKALIRRYTEYNYNAPPVYKGMPFHYGDLVMDPYCRTASIGSRTILLTGYEFDLLHFFARNPNIVLSKEQIYSAIWRDNSYFSSRSIYNEIYRLRLKLKELNLDCISTEYGYGYKFVMPLNQKHEKTKKRNCS